MGGPRPPGASADRFEERPQCTFRIAGAPFPSVGLIDRFVYDVGTLSDRLTEVNIDVVDNDCDHRGGNPRP